MKSYRRVLAVDNVQVSELALFQLEAWMIFVLHLLYTRHMTPIINWIDNFTATV